MPHRRLHRLGSRHLDPSQLLNLGCTSVFQRDAVFTAVCLFVSIMVSAIIQKVTVVFSRKRGIDKLWTKEEFIKCWK